MLYCGWWSCCYIVFGLDVILLLVLLMVYGCWSCYTVVIVGGLVDVILLKVLLILGCWSC